MKIQVVRHDGRREVLTLTEPLEIVRGDRRKDQDVKILNLDFNTGEYVENKKPELNRIVTSTGMSHFFTEDGIYDGWESEVPENCKTIEDAIANTQIINSERIILPKKQE